MVRASSRSRAGARSARSARARAGARSSCPITLTLIAFLPAFAVLAIRAIVGQTLRRPLPRAHPVPPVPDRDRARRHDLRRRSCAPSCSAPTAATTCSRCTSRRRSSRFTYVVGQVPRRARAAALPDARCPCCCCSSATRSSPTRPRATSPTTGSTCCASSRPACCSRRTSACSGSRSRRSRAGGRSRSAATRR